MNILLEVDQTLSLASMDRLARTKVAQLRLKRFSFVGPIVLVAIPVAIAILKGRDELSINFIRYQGTHGVIELTNATAHGFYIHRHVHDEIYSDGVLLPNEATVERVWIGNTTNPNASILVEKFRIEGEGVLPSLRQALRRIGLNRARESWFISARLPPRDPPTNVPPALRR